MYNVNECKFICVCSLIWLDQGNQAPTLSRKWWICPSAKLQFQHGYFTTQNIWWGEEQVTAVLTSTNHIAIPVITPVIIIIKVASNTS